MPRPVLVSCLAVLRQLGGSGWTDVAVTSTRAREGRSTVALGTALLARRRLAGPTVVVDLDFAAPALATLLSLPPAPGLAEVLRGEVELAAAICWLDPQLGVLPAGRVDAEACLLAEGVEMTKVLTRFAEAGQRVVADLPPLPPHGDGQPADRPLLRDGPRRPGGPRTRRRGPRGGPDAARPDLRHPQRHDLRRAALAQVLPALMVMFLLAALAVLGLGDDRSVRVRRLVAFLLVVLALAWTTLRRDLV